ncbi:MAG TPA: 30S ribosomal protein S6 [Candidatus Dormibacteraeota bacterium]|jgi:small subunit ribosomal protein S6|nr:30S ribosomal protein S6 [Candidatus Dormibacteraeota bacterium]
MVRDYELMYIVRPDVDDDGLRAAVDSVKSLIEGQGGEVHKTTMWGKRRLAYEVKHLRDGHYVIAELRLDGSKVAEIERALRIHDSVFRHLLVIQEVPSADTEDGEATGEVVHASPDGETVAPAPAPAATAAPESDDTADIPAADEDADADDDEVPAAVTHDNEEA